MSELQIYFCGSMRGGRQDLELYGRLIALLSSHGKVLTQHVGDPNSDQDADISGKSQRHILLWHRKMMSTADVVVAEVTQPSLGVGYEIGTAVAMDKPILCLFRPESGRILSSMIRGSHDGEKCRVVDYEESQVEQILNDFLRSHKK